MNKRIVVIFVCLLLVLVPVILFSAVFVVRDIEVISIADDTDNFVYDESKIIADSLMPLHSSIFVLSEETARHNIELKNPDVEVVNIERIFPSVVSININKRIPLVAVGIDGSSRYALVDRTLRVVKIVDSLDSYNVIDYTIYKLKLGDDEALHGIVNLDKNEVMANLLLNIISGFEQSGKVKTMIPSLVESIRIVDNKSVSINMVLGASIEVFMRPSGVTVADLTRGGLTAFLTDEKAGSDNVTHGTYYLTDNGWSHRE